MTISKIILISFSIAYASAGFSQFYVTPHFASQISPAFPLVHQQPQYQQDGFFDIPSFYQSQPLLYSQNINPFVHHTFTSSIPQVAVEQARSNNRQASSRTLDIAQSNPVVGAEYGFGYRTQYDDGATSTVVFVSGPDSKRMNLLRRNKLTARKLASDILDSKTSDEKNEKINHALSDDIPGLNFEALIESFPDFKPLEDHNTGVVHLFSHPANVFPLSSPTQTTTSLPETTTASEAANNDDPESVAVESADSDELRARSSDSSEKEAESVIQETKVLIEDIKNRSSNDNSSTESSTQTASTSSESDFTTETTSKSGEEVTTVQQ